MYIKTKDQASRVKLLLCAMGFSLSLFLVQACSTTGALSALSAVSPVGGSGTELQVGDDSLVQNKKREQSATVQTGHDAENIKGNLSQQSQSSTADSNVNTGQVETMNITNTGNPLVEIILSMALGISILLCLIFWVLPAPKWVEKRYSEKYIRELGS